MPFQVEQQTEPKSASAVLKIIVLSLFAVVTAIVSVSFAANHLKSGFEKEYVVQVNVKTEQLSAACSRLISGDEIASDPAKSLERYASLLPAMLIDSGETNQSRKIYGLYAYTNGALTPLIQSSSIGLLAVETPVSDWLTTESNPYTIQNSGQTTVLTPIKDSQGKVVGLFELSSTYSFLNTFGNAVERRVLMSVLVAVTAGIGLFSLQFIIPKIIGITRQKGRRY